MFWDNKMDNAVKSRDGRAAVSVCSDTTRKSEGYFIHCLPWANGKESQGKTQVRKPACSLDTLFANVFAIWNIV